MGAIGGGVFQSVKGFRNAPAVSSQHYCLLSDFHQVFKGRFKRPCNLSGCWKQTERQCKRSEGKSSTDWR